MNWKDVEQTVAQAQQKLQALELKALDAERAAKAAKARARQLKFEHRRAREAAKEAKHCAKALAADAAAQCRVLEKAERRLAKALRKARADRPATPRAAAPAPVGRSARMHVERSSERATPVPITGRRPLSNGRATLAAHAPRPRGRRKLSETGNL